MVSITTKKIKGNEYLYLITSERHGDKVRQKTIKYIGRKRPISRDELTAMENSYEGNDWVLNDFKDELSYNTHAKMKKASTNYKKYLNCLDRITYQKEKERFLSIFIAHSNAIEGSTITPKETFDFLFKDTVPKNSAKKELFMAANLYNAWLYVEKNKHTFPTHKDLKELHKRVNRDMEQETLGKYKRVQNYIGDIPTTSWVFIEDKIEQLLRWIKKAFKKIDNFEVAFQSHAQFEIIHPFIDGNGRVGRLLLSWLLMYKNLLPLAIPVKLRAEYISSLENARRGNLAPICDFCSKIYLKQYVTF